MTIVIGALCEGGAVFGADEAMTNSQPGGGPAVATHPTDKLRISADGKLVFLHTGEVGVGQRTWNGLEKWASTSPTPNIRTEADNHAGYKKALLGVYQGEPIYAIAQDLVKGVGSLDPRAMTDSSSRYLGGGICMVPSKDTGVSVFANEGVSAIWCLAAEKVRYAVLGSGLGTGDPFLGFISEILWSKKVPSRKHALLGVYWTITHAIRCGAHSGVGGRPALGHFTSAKEGKNPMAVRLSDEELLEVEQEVRDLERSIGELFHASIPQAERAPSPPLVPVLDLAPLAAPAAGETSKPAN
jgi:hypothetical protein